MDVHEVRQLISSLEDYLNDLRDTGVDGIPLGETMTPPSLPSSLPEPAAVKSVSPKEEVPMISGHVGLLSGIRVELGDCRRCGLSATRSNLVFGAGSPKARLVFVGEAPGGEEDREGVPFVGDAGKLLTKIIQAMGFSRDEVYICNVIKCRPPQNRNPQPDEIEQCHPFLLRQIQAIRPEIVVALGTFAAQTLLQTKEPISRLRGVFHDYHGISLMPTFHPAYLLRNAGMKREVWQDMQKVMIRLGKEFP